jgi:protein-disulfide isomerase
MKARSWTAWVLASAFLFGLGAGLAAGQQDDGPVLRPKANQRTAAATLLVMCDLACNWKLDGEAKGHIDAGGAAKAKVELGQHMVAATTVDGVDQVKQLSTVRSNGQTVVSLELEPVQAMRLKAAKEAQEKEESSAKVAELKPPVPSPAPSTLPGFPPPGPANLTTAAPSKDTIDAFLQASWGYDETRTWQIQSIEKTPVEGMSKVIIVVGDKTGKQKPASLQFLVLADGKHIVVGDETLPFGAHPYADYRAQVQQRADGPYRGSAAKALELVEFADFQCPHCKQAQASMDKLAADFPNARIVFQNYPLPQHSADGRAAAFGVCVAKLGGNNAFFNFSSAVFQRQDDLATPDGATAILYSAVSQAGLDPATIEACASAPATISAVDASVKLAKDLNIHQLPMLVVNGREVTATAPYDTLKKMIEYQEKLDGITQ